MPQGGKEGAKSAAKRQKTGFQKPAPKNKKDSQTHEPTKHKKSANGGTKKATQRPPKPQNPKKIKSKVLKQIKINLKTTKRKPPQKHQQNPLFNPLKNR